ncbi:MAG: hypothetical protein ROO76_22140 [Terriglobia bacterium]|jgi:hypothetical protein|nr:hypothetical protein [Terriglobia bacterium]
MIRVAISLLAIVLLFAGLIGIVFAGRWLMRKLLGLSPEEQALEAEKRGRERLLSPRWSDLEQHHRRAIPNIIKDLYSDQDVITMRGITLRRTDGKLWSIREFLPADLRTVSDLPAELRSTDIFPFATSTSGDVYYIALDQGSYPVKMSCKLGGEELVAPKVVDFIAGLDRARDVKKKARGV